MGLSFDVHKTAQLLNGYYGVDRQRSAHIVVPKDLVKNISYADVGFLQNSDGKYSLVADFKWGHKTKFLKQFNQLYGKHRVIKQVRRMGYTISSQKVDRDGRIKIRVRAR